MGRPPSGILHPMKRFALIFTAIVVTLFALELTRPVQHAAVDPWTSGVARISTQLVKVFDSTVVSSGPTLYSPGNGFGMTILSGCNGVEAMIVLLAAIVAYPAPWKYRFAGLAGGVLAIQLLNIVRIVSLFYIGQWSPAAFEWAHLYLWQALIMLDAMVVWLLWLRSLPPVRPAA